MALMQAGLQMATGRLPKVIKPWSHAMIDYGVAGGFLVAGAFLWKRNKRAALGCFICGGATAANSLVTDYPGGVFREISYKNHGRINTGIAGLTAAMPSLMNFNDEPEAGFFSSCALGLTAITGLTDFDYYEYLSPRRLRHQDEPAA